MKIEISSEAISAFIGPIMKAPQFMVENEEATH
jgi:hypothetical protein